MRPPAAFAPVLRSDARKNDVSIFNFLHMKFKSLITSLFVLLLSAVAISQTSDQLDALKQNLSPEEQQALLQGVMGQGTGSGSSTTKSDPRLNMPQTVQPKNGDRTGFEQVPKERKTPDGHVLRQSNEDLQLRADDSVLIELVPLYDLRTGVPCNYQTNSNNNNNGYNENGDRNASNCNNNNNNNNNAIEWQQRHPRIDQ